VTSVFGGQVPWICSFIHARDNQQLWLGGLWMQVFVYPHLRLPRRGKRAVRMSPEMAGVEPKRTTQPMRLGQVLLGQFLHGISVVLKCSFTVLSESINTPRRTFEPIIMVLLKYWSSPGNAGGCFDFGYSKDLSAFQCHGAANGILAICGDDFYFRNTSCVRIAGAG